MNMKSVSDQFDDKLYVCIYTNLIAICILLYIMLAYIMLFTALSNAVCLYNAFFIFFFSLPLICANAFCFHALSRFIDT